LEILKLEHGEKNQRPKINSRRLQKKGLAREKGPMGWVFGGGVALVVVQEKRC